MCIKMNKSLTQAKSFFRFNSYKAVRRPDISVNRKLTAPQVNATSKDNDGSNLTTYLRAKILATGPVTVADYMKEVLTNPYAGYYMNRDVFGREGDFITSPEVCQIFGELVAVWCLTEWRKLGSPSPFQIVELGPGRGTLSRDLLNVLSHFKLGGIFSLHMVEISPFLSKMQAQILCLDYKEFTDAEQQFTYYMKGETVSGIEIFWYKRLEDVPRQFSIVIAHEFFDALPVHKLQQDNGKWKEVLIDIDPQDINKFRYVISKDQTPISKIFQPVENETRQCLEYSLEADRIVSIIAERFENDGGIGLIMDYGHSGEKSDTFRAFKKHQLHDPLVEPGSADLTADVDFRQLKRVAEQARGVLGFGPVEQGFFLKEMEGDVRLKILLENALPENRDRIESGYKMLTEPKGMGSRFKFFSIFPAVLKDHIAKYPISGFN